MLRIVNLGPMCREKRSSPEVQMNFVEASLNLKKEVGYDLFTDLEQLRK